MKKKIIIIGALILSWSFFSSAIFQQSPAQHVAIKAIYIDEFGNKWFGTRDGLYMFNDIEWTRYSSADHVISEQINALTFEQSINGPELWVATDEGVSVVAFDIDGITGATSYTAEDGVYGTKIMDVVVDSRNYKFFGSDQGITYFHDGSMDSITYNENKSSLLNAPVNDMAIFNDSIYIGYGIGIGRLVSEVDGVTGASRWTNGYGITPLSGNILAVEIDSDGNQWFGTDAGAEKHLGLNAKDNWLLYTEDDGLVNNMVLVIREDKDGAVWFGTEGGVSMLKNDLWTNYNKSDGLVSDTVYDIAFEENGTIWFATAEGISKMSDGEITTVDITTSNSSSVDVSLSGKIYQISSNNLMVQFNQEVQGPVQISVFDVSGKQVGSSTKNVVTENQMIIQLDDKFQRGIYFVKALTNNGLVLSEKVLLLK